MIDKKFKQILERDKDLKKIRIHDLRHSHTSLLINQGEDYLVVKERLGHASITTLGVRNLFFDIYVAFLSIN